MTRQFTWRDRASRAAAAALAATFAVLLPAAITSTWIRGTILSTSGYVAAVTPVAASPAVRTTVQEAVTAQVDAALSRAETTLPAAAGPLASGLADLAGNEVSDFMASSAFQQLWADTNKLAHSQLISVLNGDSTLVTATGGQVVLNLVPLINEALRTISGRLSDLSGGRIALHPVSAIPAAACQVVATVSHQSLSPACGQIPLFPAAALAGPRLAYRVLTTATGLVLVITPLAFAGALAVSPAPRRRRTLLQMTVGGTATLLVALIALSRLRSTLISGAAPRYQAVTSVIVHALTNSFFTPATWAIAAGFAVAAIALLSGPYRWAATVRAGLKITA